MAALDAGVPLRDVQIAARHVDLRTTTIYERPRGFFDDVAAFTAVAADDAVAPPVVLPWAALPWIVAPR